MDSVTQDGEEMRVCEGVFGCGERKPASEFWKGDKSCKDCRRKRKAAVDAGKADPTRLRAGRRVRQVLNGETPQVPSYAVMKYEGVPIAWERDHRAVCFTDLWIAAGRPESLEPKYWLRSTIAQGLIDAYALENDVTRDHVILSRRSGSESGAGGGGTWGPREIALAYAQVLNPRLWLACNRFVLDRHAPAPPHDGLGEDRYLLQRIAEQLGILPRIESKADAILGVLDGADHVRVKEVWNGQVYIVRIVNDALLTLTRRQYKNIPNDAAIIAIGRTGADGNVHDLRLCDYAGKWPVQPDDYEVLATFGTDAPAEAEDVLLKNPLRGCVRLRQHKGGAVSKTFMAATQGNERQYAVFRQQRHYTIAALRMLVTGIGGQIDMWGGAA